MNWLRRFLGLHVHEWMRFGEYTIPDQYRASEGMFPAMQLVGRTIYMRACDCGHSEEYYPATASDKE